MLVTIVRAGGLAGFVRQTELDSAALPPDAAAGLRRLFEALTRDPGSSPVGPDELWYELTVVDDDLTWTVRTTDRALAEPARVLIAFVDGRDERRESVAPL